MPREVCTATTLAGKPCRKVVERTGTGRCGSHRIGPFVPSPAGGYQYKPASGIPARGAGVPEQRPHADVVAELEVLLGRRPTRRERSAAIRVEASRYLMRLMLALPDDVDADAKRQAGDVLDRLGAE